MASTRKGQVKMKRRVGDTEGSHKIYAYLDRATLEVVLGAIVLEGSVRQGRDTAKDLLNDFVFRPPTITTIADFVSQFKEKNPTSPLRANLCTRLEDRLEYYEKQVHLSRLAIEEPTKDKECEMEEVGALALLDELLGLMQHCTEIGGFIRLAEFFQVRAGPAKTFWLSPEGQDIMSRALLTATKGGSPCSTLRILMVLGGISANVPCDGILPLHQSLLDGHHEISMWFLKEGEADPELRAGRHGVTALHLATQKCYVPIIEYLVKERKVDVSAEDYDGHRPICYAILPSKITKNRGGVVDVKATIGIIDLLLDEMGEKAIKEHGSLPLPDGSGAEHDRMSRELAVIHVLIKPCKAGPGSSLITHAAIKDKAELVVQHLIRRVMMYALPEVPVTSPSDNVFRCQTAASLLNDSKRFYGGALHELEKQKNSPTNIQIKGALKRMLELLAQNLIELEGKCKEMRKIIKRKTEEKRKKEFAEASAKAEAARAAILTELQAEEEAEKAKQEKKKAKKKKKGKGGGGGNANAGVEETKEDSPSEIAAAAAGGGGGGGGRRLMKEPQGLSVEADVANVSTMQQQQEEEEEEEKSLAAAVAAAGGGSSGSSGMGEEEEAAAAAIGQQGGKCGEEEAVALMSSLLSMVHGHHHHHQEEEEGGVAASKAGNEVLVDEEEGVVDEYQDDTGAPEDYICPITHALMRDPVTASDGHTYEREAILQWINRAQERNQTLLSPKEGRPMDPFFIPSKTVRIFIQEFIKQRRANSRRLVS